MVQRIKIRGHLIRFHGVQASGSQTEPAKCPGCNDLYNDGNKRNCEFLCCRFRLQRCFECVKKDCKYFICPEFLKREKIRKKYRTGVNIRELFSNSNDEVENGAETRRGAQDYSEVETGHETPENTENETGQGTRKKVTDSVTGDGGKQNGQNLTLTNESLVQMEASLEAEIEGRLAEEEQMESGLEEEEQMEGSLEVKEQMECRLAEEEQMEGSLKAQMEGNLEKEGQEQTEGTLEVKEVREPSVENVKNISSDEGTEDSLIDCENYSFTNERTAKLIPKHQLQPKVVLERVTIFDNEAAAKSDPVATPIRKSERARKVINWWPIFGVTNSVKVSQLP